MSLLRQSLLAACSALVLTGSRFAFTAILARRLSVEVFGKFAYAQWLIDITFLVCALGATGAVSRYAAEFSNVPKKLQGFIRQWRFWALGLPLLGGVVALFSARVSGFVLDSGTSLMLVLWGAAAGITAMHTAALSGMQRFDLIFRSNIFLATTMLIGAAVLPFDADASMMLFGLMTFASALGAVPGVFATWRIKSDIGAVLDASTWRAIRKYALNMWIVALLWSLLWSRGELPIVKASLGDTGVASYVAILTLFGGAIQGVMLGVSAVAPQLTRLWGEGRKQEAVALARDVMDIQLLVCGAAAATLVFLGPELLTLAFGSQYRMHAGALAMLSLGLISMVVANQNHLLQVATNGSFSRNSLVAGLFVLMGSAIVLTYFFGLEGAAAARACSMILLAGIAIYRTFQKWGRDSVSLLNITAVFLPVLLGVFVSIRLLSVHLGLRILFLSLTLGSYAFSVRDTTGNRKLIIMLRMMAAKLHAVSARN